MSVSLNDDVNGDTVRLADAGMRIFPDGGTGVPYTPDQDVHYTITNTCPINLDNVDSIKLLSIVIENITIYNTDTLYIYDGYTTDAPLLWKGNSSYRSNNALTIFVSPTNLEALTIRFYAAPSNVPDSLRGGFSLYADCNKPCEKPTPTLSQTFIKTRNGEPYATQRMTKLYSYDTVYRIDTTTDDNGFMTFDTVLVGTDTSSVDGINLCLGDGVILSCDASYTHTTGWYNSTNANTHFVWTMGNGTQIDTIGGSSIYYEGYSDLDCYDLSVSLVDTFGCQSLIPTTARVRLAQNPIKTLFTLATICNVDSLQVNIGFDGDNATMTLRHITFEKVRSRTNDAKTYIPDGPRCVDILGVKCYEAPVEFDEFPPGRSVTSAADICSICVNYEHTYMGDYSMAIICPTYQTIPSNPEHGIAMLKNYQPVRPVGPGVSPEESDIDGTYSGGGTFTGLPYGGDYSPWDGYAGTPPVGTPNYCDTIYNMYGFGYNYCFSLNSEYTLVTGEPANTYRPVGAGIASTGHTHSETINFGPIPYPYAGAGESAGEVTFTTKDSSDHANKMDYYVPADDFSTLIGCPLNGTWKIQICDNLSRDNGWVFSWSLDICGVSSGSGCEYQVGIDSVLWYPDPDERYNDYETGKYRGLQVHKRDETRSFLLSPDTAGTFPIKVNVYDEFGCVWDTSTRITTVWTPEPRLGNDTLLCSIESIVLDASDRHSETCNFSYVWEPNGQVSDTIHTDRGIIGERNYIAEVVNKQHSIRCTARDTIVIRVNRQPVPNFDPGVYPLEGCAPYTVTFNNTSTDGDHYLWVFGDGVTSTDESPIHSFDAGSFDFKYYIYSADGCVDSLVYPNLVTVFPHPQASFSWNPTYPTVLNPNVQFINHTTPDWDNNKYYWEVQYNRAHPLSVQTETDHDPYFNWFKTTEEDLPGNYIVRLIARTDNLGPSGNMTYCYDTAENSILLVNDFLQFPNVVTPNGDGVNDRFVIKNLIDGLGFPINQLDIYNKWGAHVYHKVNIASDDDFWDPNTNNMPAGTYFFRFSAKGYNGNIERNGTIEVVR